MDNIKHYCSFYTPKTIHALYSTLVQILHISTDICVIQQLKKTHRALSICLTRLLLCLPHHLTTRAYACKHHHEYLQALYLLSSSWLILSLPIALPAASPPRAFLSQIYFTNGDTNFLIPHSGGATNVTLQFARVIICDGKKENVLEIEISANDTK